MSVRTMPGTRPRNGLPLGDGYVYNGSGRDRLMRGEAVPGAPGACSRERCAHSAPYHRNGRGRGHRGSACRSCRCPGWTDEAGAVMPPEPDAQLTLFGEAA
jgi:hypothetical protein